MSREDGWTAEALHARIENVGSRRRHPGGSPCPEEVAAYAEGLGPSAGRGLAIVLGMTPELRAMALERFDRVLACDVNPSAIALYRDWVPAQVRGREEIIRCDWLEGLSTRGRADAILGDGVFGNLAGVEDHRRLLRAVAAALTDVGRFVTRMAMRPEASPGNGHSRRDLIDLFRRGWIDEAEFGFGVRLEGHLGCCYDPASHTLDCAKLFDEEQAAEDTTEREKACIFRYRFRGRNCIVDRATWERLLREEGWAFRAARLKGRRWYGYYVVYSCWRRNGGQP